MAGFLRIALVVGAVAVSAHGCTSRTLPKGAAGEDGWPRFLGVDGAGRSSETGLLRTWPEAGPDVAWRVPFGDGFSSLAIDSGRLFTMEARDDAEYVVCLDAESGVELWRSRIGDRFDDPFDPRNGGPRSTPTVAGGVVYSLGAQGSAVALRVEDGSRLWQVDLARRFPLEPPPVWYGYSQSLLVVEDRVVVGIGGGEATSIVALSAADGTVTWTALSDMATYASPLAVRLNARLQIVVVTPSRVAGLSLSGETLWQHPWDAFWVVAAMPVFVPPDSILVSASYDVGSRLLRVTSGGDAPQVDSVWHDKVMRAHFSTPVLVDGFLYGFDNATLKCVDVNTAEERWAKRGLGKGSLIYADGHLFVLGERGLVLQIAASPERYEERGRLQALTGKAWTVPSLANGKLYLRSQTEIVALHLRP